jgi:copper chaperone CopZ
MPDLTVVAILMLVSVGVFVLTARAVARRRAPLRSRSSGRTGPPATPAPSVAAPRTLDPVRFPESVARAFPVHGLPAGRDAAAALERVLRGLAGVTKVYVSPVTALAYLDYLPAEVTEDALVQAMQRQGYGVGDAARRFDWRHVQSG